MGRGDASPDFAAMMEVGREMRNKSFSQVESAVDAMIEVGVSAEDRQVLDSFKTRLGLSLKREVSPRGKPETVIVYNKLGDEGGVIADKETGSVNAWFKNDGDVETFMGAEGTNRDEYELISNELSEEGKLALLKGFGAVPDDTTKLTPYGLRDIAKKNGGGFDVPSDLYWNVTLPTDANGVSVRLGRRGNVPANEVEEFMSLSFAH